MTMRQRPAGARTLKGLTVPSALDAASIIDMIAEHGDRVAQAVAQAAGIDASEVADAPIPDFVALTSEVIAVNADFFAQAVQSMVAALPAPPANGDGPTQPKP
jgi:hypothetical protein